LGPCNDNIIESSPLADVVTLRDKKTTRTHVVGR
jgi:hypothetical protein